MTTRKENRLVSCREHKAGRKYQNKKSSKKCFMAVGFCGNVDKPCQDWFWK